MIYLGWNRVSKTAQVRWTVTLFLAPWRRQDCKMSRRFEEDSSHEISSFSVHLSCSAVPVCIFSVLRLRQERRSCCFFSIRRAGCTRSGAPPILICCGHSGPPAFIPAHGRHHSKGFPRGSVAVAG